MKICYKIDQNILSYHNKNSKIILIGIKIIFTLVYYTKLNHSSNQNKSKP